MATIDIKPIEAEMTRDVSSIGKMDPYCKITVGSCMRTTIPHIDGSKMPKWKESLHYKLDDEEAIKVEVWDRNSVSSDDLVGTASFLVSDVKTAKRLDDWYNLKFKGGEAGRIHVVATYTRDPADPEPAPEAPAAPAAPVQARM
jgi:Ca2+-dependent lipid-binding protein